ncbi:MAG: VOC family protein [Acidimicrobiaceae bacterium]|nr:VOC family protein [Acidimicrobiaceae bacterium]
MQLTTCLWFDGNAREAAEYYAEVFPDSSVEGQWIAPGETPSNEIGSEVVVEFTLMGTKFIGLNGGPAFRFNEAISFQIPCEDQDEIDRYWQVLTADGGEEGKCGWLKDRFGVSWQVTSPRMSEFLGGPSQAGSKAATEVMLAMNKINLSELQAAYESAQDS